ncbi:MAG TPA: MFS transporter [Micromonosporaceae bacterium]
MPPVLRPPRRSVLILAYLAFVSLGLPDGLIGVGWPSIRSAYQVPTEAVGLLLTAGTLGYLASSVAAGFSTARLGIGRLLAISTSLTALALAGYALAPALPFMIVAALLLGSGGGAIDAGLNAYAAGAFGPRHMNWLHAFFGLGVTLGPLIMTAAIGVSGTWRAGYAAVAVAQAALAVGFAAGSPAWRQRPAGRPDVAVPAGARPTPVRATLSLPATWLGMLAFAFYGAIEIATGLWAFLLLTEDRGVAATTAGVCVSAYWGCLLGGRVVQGFVAERLGVRAVLAGSLAGLCVGSLLVAVPAPAWVAVAGLCVVGFAAAAVFPLLTLTTGARVGAAHADRVVGLQIGAAGLGGALIPAAVGVLLSRTDVGALGAALLVLSTALLGIHLLGIHTRQPRPAVDREEAQFGPVRPVVDGR